MNSILTILWLSFVINFYPINYFHRNQCSPGSSLNKKNIQDPDWWRKEAKKMVESQLISRDITDTKVIEIMAKTPRHRFIPTEISDYAYHDKPLPIGDDQTISQPYIVALMTQLLNLKGDEKILEIGTGSGYQAAILSQLIDTCYSIEIVKNHAMNAARTLKNLGFNNVVVKWGDGYKGWKEHAPFDGIIVTAAPPFVPPVLLEQLKPGGKIVIPVGEFFQELLVVTKDINGNINEKSIIPVRFVPMIHPKKNVFADE